MKGGGWARPDHGEGGGNARVSAPRSVLAATMIWLAMATATREVQEESIHQAEVEAKVKRWD